MLEDLTVRLLRLLLEAKLAVPPRIFDSPFAEFGPPIGSVNSGTELPRWIKLCEGEGTLDPPSMEFFAIGGCGFGGTDGGEDTTALG